MYRTLRRNRTETHRNSRAKCRRSFYELLQNASKVVFVLLTFSSVGQADPKTVYPKKTDLDFEGLRLEGEYKNPAEFYFKSRPQEKFNSLVEPRPNFHREILRDVVMSR